MKRISLAVLALLTCAALPAAGQTDCDDPRAVQLRTTLVRDLETEQVTCEAAASGLVDRDDLADVVLIIRYQNALGEAHNRGEVLYLLPGAPEAALLREWGGSRGLIRDIVVQDRVVVVNSMQYHPGEPLCCPTIPTVTRYRARRGQLHVQEGR